MRHVLRVIIAVVTILGLICIPIMANIISSEDELTVDLGPNIKIEVNKVVGFYATTNDPYNIKTYKWDLDGDGEFDEIVEGSGDPNNDPKMNYTYTKIGIYNVTVLVTNKENKTAYDNVTVKVVAPEVANFTVEVTPERHPTVKVGQEATFTATLKSTEEIPNEARVFKWDFDYNGYFKPDMYSDEIYVNSNTMSYVYDEPGEYRVVVDVEGKRGEAYIKVEAEKSGGIGGFTFRPIFFVPIVIVIIGFVVFSLWRSGRLYLPERTEKPRKEKPKKEKIAKAKEKKIEKEEPKKEEKPKTKKCPKCGGLILVPSSKRPLVVTCSVCGKQYTLKKKEEKEEKPKTKKCPQCGGVIYISSSKRPLKVKCSSCGKEYTLKKKEKEEITDIAICPKCGKSVPVKAGQKKVRCSCGEEISIE